MSKVILAVAITVIAMGLLVLWSLMSCYEADATEPFYSEPDFVAAVDAYEQWLSEYGLKESPSSSINGGRDYFQFERDRFLDLSKRIQVVIDRSHEQVWPGTRLVHLRDLALIQSDGFGQWLEDHNRVDEERMKKAGRLISTSYIALQHEIVLFKLLLGRNDHGLHRLRGRLSREAGAD